MNSRDWLIIRILTKRIRKRSSSLKMHNNQDNSTVLNKYNNFPKFKNGSTRVQVDDSVGYLANDPETLLGILSKTWILINLAWTNLSFQ